MRLDQRIIKYLVHEKNPLILEIGAHHGEDTEAFLKEFKDIKIYCFEPDPRCIAKFKKNIVDSRCNLVEAAVSSNDGKTILTMSEGFKTNLPYLVKKLGLSKFYLWGLSILKRTIVHREEWDWLSSVKECVSYPEDRPWVIFDKQIEVATTKLDTWIERENISSVDFVWADANGAERDLIEGAAETLKKTKYFYTEYGEMSSYPDAMTREETIALLSEHNFEVVEEYSDEGKIGNLLFVNKYLEEKIKSKVETKLLILKSSGFFYLVNSLIHHLYLAEQGGYKFIVDWSESLYKDDSMKGDPWNYYFEDCFHDTGIPLKALSVDLFNKDNVIVPRVQIAGFERNRNGFLLLPKDRYLVNKIISKYIKLKPHLKKKIDDFRNKNFQQYTIGLHIRGAGRVNGGVPILNRQHKLKKGVPFDLYFKFVDEHLQEHKSAKIFLCSDSGMVIDECRKKYGDRIITYSKIRSHYGEMHNNYQEGAIKKNKGLTFPKYKLGEEVLIDAYLLSETDFLVHGNSSVTNFILCNKPDLKSEYVYKDTIPRPPVLYKIKEAIKNQIIRS